MLAERISSTSHHLIERLPEVRGKLTAQVALAETTWFRVGGPAEVLFKPADEEDLASFLAGSPPDVPITVLGVASNILVRDGGVPGVVIRLGPQFANIKTSEWCVTAGASALDLNIARAAQQSSISGLEFLCGIPGTLGGGLRMNAGAYNQEFKDIVRTATLFDRSGGRKVLKQNEIGFSYRHTDVSDDSIFISATLEGVQGEASLIHERMLSIQKSRTTTQPIREKTGGSTFANPDQDPLKRKAWQLIDAAGCRGLKIGQAMVSEMHCNFLINTGHATAADIEELGEEVRRRVKEHSGVDLRWEIKRIGVPRHNEGAI